MSPKKASELMVNCAEFEYKVEADQIAAVAEKAVAELRDKLDSEYKAAAASFPDEDIFMAIADDIGFDATGKPTKVNELDEIGAELAKFISKERGDE
jgi:type I restriction enzyme M protein